MATASGLIEPNSNRRPISTYDTDYVLILEEWAGAAISALQQAGHELWPRDESWRNLIE